MSKYAFQCLLLSGMPASGKDTISKGLVELEPTFVHFRKHKTDPELRSKLDNSYILVPTKDFDEIANRSGFVQWHSRYGRMYGVSKEELEKIFEAGRIPIIHVGKYENLISLRKGDLRSALSVMLWSDRDVVEERLAVRHKHRLDGIAERLAAYDQDKSMLEEYAKTEPLDFDLVFINNGFDPMKATQDLLQRLRECRSSKALKVKSDNDIRQLLG